MKDEERWERNFQLLLQFRDREGHLNVPAKLEEWDASHNQRVRLGNWVAVSIRYTMYIQYLYVILVLNSITITRRIDATDLSGLPRARRYQVHCLFGPTV